MEKKLFKYKSFKVNGVKFCIRQLSPLLFSDKDYGFPMSTVIEDSADSISSNNKEIESFKDKMKDTILKGVVFLQSGLFKKTKKDIKDMIDTIMDKPELYSFLYTKIVYHSFGIKKKLSTYFDLTEISLKQYI